MEWLRIQRRSSLRRFIYFVLPIAGLLVSVILSILTFSQPALADDASWNWRDNSISYNGATFKRLYDSHKTKAMGLDPKEVVYTNAGEGGFGKSGEIGVIHFPSNSDVRSLTSVKYTTYGFVPPNTFSRQGDSDITITPLANDGTAASCNVEGGLSWFICPVSSGLASAIDWMFNVIKIFLVVPPLEINNRSGGLFMAWDIVRNIANTVFIIVFLVIIYSQITSTGVSNYGIKKLLPRLVIAALAINVSFIACASLLDLSNIAGGALEDMFMSVRDNIAALGSSAPVELSWSEITALVLGGSGGVAALVAFGPELLPFLVPLLVGAGLILLMVVVILAARQAIIVLLIVLSPLAFVCYLLPGTEKWFDKWKDTLLTMLIFFPGFAAAFGGAQLASIIIIQNATGPNSAVMMLLGIAVQIAPLAITPLLIKLGGGILGKFTGMMNDRRKGLFDRSMNFAKDYRDILRGRRFAASKDRGRRYGVTAFRRNFDARSRSRKARAEAWRGSGMDALAADTKYGRRAEFAKREIEQRKQIGDKLNEGAWYNHQSLNPSAYGRAMRERTTSLEAQLAQSKIDTSWEEFRAGRAPHPLGESAKFDLKTAQDITKNLAAQSLRQENARRVQDTLFAQSLMQNEALLKEAGGIHGKVGVDAAMARATDTMRSEMLKSIGEAQQLIKHFKIGSDDLQELARGGTITVTDANGIAKEFGPNNIYLRESAYDNQIKYGTAQQVAELISGLDVNAEFRSTVASSLAASDVLKKAPFLGGGMLDKILTGKVRNEATLHEAICDWVQKGKFSAETFTNFNGYSAALFIEALTKGIPGKRMDIIDAEHLNKLKEGIDRALTDPLVSRGLTEGVAEKLSDLKSKL